MQIFSMKMLLMPNYIVIFAQSNKEDERADTTRME